MHAVSLSGVTTTFAFRLPRLTRGRVFAGLAVILGGVIGVNATLFQTEKHPAPMFRQLAKPAPQSTLPLPPLRPEFRDAPEKMPSFERTQSIPASANPGKERLGLRDKPPAAASADVSDLLVSDIQTELFRRGFYKGESDGKMGPGTSKAIRDFQFSRRVAVDGIPSEALLGDIRAVRATMKDELLDIVKRSGAPEKPTPAAKKEAPAAKKTEAPAAKKTEAPAAKAEPEKPSKTVADVQRALNKAGYGPLGEDGRMGPGTKAALAKFEADRKLPTRGEPKGPVLKHLAQASGIKISP